MPTGALPDPDTVLGVGDPGADIQRRFRYQASYAALISLDLLEDTCEFVELFCEHQEDVLVKNVDGKFSALQVKTRAPGLEPFKAGDEEILHALKRFLDLDRLFPGRISRFVIATNIGFWHERKNASNLPYLLELARNSPPGDGARLSGHLRALLKKLTISKGLIPDGVIAVLAQVELQGDLPRFDDMPDRLVHRLAEVRDLGSRDYADLKRVAKALIEATLAAGSLVHESASQVYFALFDNPQAKRTDAIIEGKRITRSTIERIIQETISAEALLRACGHVPLSALPKSMHKMDLKMAAGGISVDAISLAKDHKLSAESLLTHWLHKWGPEKANERYEHLRTLVRTECQESYDAVHTCGRLFGAEMIAEVRRRLREREVRDRPLLFGCIYEHLLGIAGIITEDCTLWWSERFEIPKDLA